MSSPEWIPYYTDAINIAELNPVMNNTKWNELRLKMYGLYDYPRFRCKHANGYYSSLDGEWYYHFREGGYERIVYVDIFIENPKQRELVRERLKIVHVPGEETADGFRVYGYARPGKTLSYI